MYKNIDYSNILNKKHKRLLKRPSEELSIGLELLMKRLL